MRGCLLPRYLRRKASRLSERIEEIGIAKCIGIILVVLGHSFGAGLFAAKLYHMPLFFFISGMVLSPAKTPADFIKARLGRLYIPFVIYEIVFLALNPVLVFSGVLSHRMQSIPDYARALLHIFLFDNYNILLSPLWFLSALFAASAAAYFILRYAKGLSAPALSAISVILILFGILMGRRQAFDIGLSYNFPQVVNVSIEGCGYVLAGYVSRKNLVPAMSFYLASKKNISAYIGVAVTILFAAMMFFERKTHLTADMRKNSYDLPWLQPVFAAVGIAFVFAASHAMICLKGRIKPLWALCDHIGERSFSIMCLHPIAFKVISLIQVNVFHMDREKLPDWQVVSTSPAWLVLVFLAGIIIPLCADALYEKTLAVIRKPKT